MLSEGRAGQPVGKIVHLARDDKFVDMALRDFEAVAPGRNLLIILGAARSLQYVSTPHAEFRSPQGLIDLLQSAACCAVVFHSMTEPSLLGRIPPGKRVIWLGWGFDYYDRLLSAAYPQGLCLGRTRALMARHPDGRRPKWLGGIKQAARWMLGRGVRQTQGWLARVDCFAPVLEAEYRMARELNPWFRPRFIAWNYGTAEDDYGALGSTSLPLGTDVLVGNSATPENNHLEVFDALAACPDRAGRRIVVPLSYGDPWYRDEVIREGRTRFGDQLLPLTDYMAPADYSALLQGCGQVVMNHLRQQALGNICIMLIKGARLYLNPRNPLHAWLQAAGAQVETVPGTGATQPRLLEPLDEPARRRNFEVVMACFGREVQREKSRRMAEYALQAA